MSRPCLVIGVVLPLVCVERFSFRKSSVWIEGGHEGDGFAAPGGTSMRRWNCADGALRGFFFFLDIVAEKAECCELGSHHIRPSAVVRNSAVLNATASFVSLLEKRVKGGALSLPPLKAPPIGQFILPAANCVLSSFCSTSFPCLVDSFRHIVDASRPSPISLHSLTGRSLDHPNDIILVIVVCCLSPI